MAFKRRRRFWRLHLGEQSSSHRWHRKPNQTPSNVTRSNRINPSWFQEPREFRNHISRSIQSSQPSLARKEDRARLQKNQPHTLSNRKRLSRQRLHKLFSSTNRIRPFRRRPRKRTTNLQLEPNLLLPVKPIARAPPRTLLRLQIRQIRNLRGLIEKWKLRTFRKVCLQ